MMAEPQLPESRIVTTLGQFNHEYFLNRSLP
jgi:hypothetical protein